MADIKHDEATHSTMQRLFTDGVLVDLDVAFWRATTANTPADLGLKRDKISGHVAGLGTHRLLSKDEVYRWSRIADRARYEIEKRAFRFPIGEGMFVPLSRVEALEKALDEIKKEFDTTTEDFLRNYETRRREFLAEYPDHRARLARQYPATDELAPKFRFTYRLFSVTMPKVVRRQAAEAKALEKYERALDEQAGRFLTEVVTTLRTKVVDTCQRISGRIGRGEIVTDASLNSIRNFLDEYKSMNFIGDPTVEATLEAVRQQTLGTAEQYKSNEQARNALVAALDNASKIAGSIGDVNQVTGEYRRRIKG